MEQIKKYFTTLKTLFVLNIIFITILIYSMYKCTNVQMYKCTECKLVNCVHHVDENSKFPFAENYFL